MEKKFFGKLMVLFAFAAVGAQFSCNKTDAALIVQGIYRFAPATSFTTHKYTILPADGSTRILDTAFVFFDEPYPFLEITKNNKQEVTVKQFLPKDTITFSKVRLTLDRNGTLLNSEVVNGRFLEGIVTGYEMRYSVWDTSARRLNVARRVIAPR